MEAICSSETSVETQQSTLRHIPENDTLHNVNLTSRKQCFPVLCYLECRECYKRIKKRRHSEYVIISNVYMSILFLHIELNKEKMGKSHRNKTKLI
jgi:hypothetical protein